MEINQLGPVDWIVIELPGTGFYGEIAPALAALVERDLIRVLDLVIVKKGADDSFEAFELFELDDNETGELRAYESQLTMLLSAEDLEAVAGELAPGSSAAVVVWENTWAAPFDAAVRSSGGHLVASGRLPTQSILAAVEGYNNGAYALDADGPTDSGLDF